MKNSNVEKREVCLVMPPCTFPHMPSLALGVLKSCLLKEGISCYVDYANVYFIRDVGIERYKKLYQGRLAELPCEFLFNESAGISNSYTPKDLIRNLAGKELPDQIYAEFDLLMQECGEVVPGFIEDTVQRILARDPKAVGCSAVFEQRNAGLAILKRIKELRPEIRTFMGGYNCFGEAGIAMLKEFPYLDYVFFGESDDIFADVVKDIIDRKDAELPYGVLKNGGPYPDTAPHRALMDMTKAPMPDYDEYFDLMKDPIGRNAVKGLGLDISLAIEASRGCWWGEKHQCTFCGENGKIKEFRKKPYETVLRELEYLTDRYQCRKVAFCDCILPHDASEDLLPALIDQGKGYELSVEIKANMNRDRIGMLSHAGCSVIQPGIESLSDHQLQLMNKGVTAVQNIALLKYAKEYNSHVRWNILVGFPGEVLKDYSEQDELLPLLEHLDAPMAVIDIAYMKDNVYYNHQEEYGLHLVTPEMFRMVSPEDSDYFEKIAFFFEETKLTKDPLIELEKASLKNSVIKWKLKEVKEPVHLDFVRVGESIRLTDTRSCAAKEQAVLSGLLKEVCIAALEPISTEHLHEALGERYSDEEIDDAIGRLREDKVLLYLSNRFLFLAVEKKQ